MNRIAIVALLLIVQPSLLADTLKDSDPQYIPGVLIKNVEPDIGNVVDTAFIEMTKEWREYKDKIDSAKFTTTKIYEDDGVKEDIHYLNGELVLVDYLESAYDVLSQKQYYRNGKIYLCLFNVDKQGDFDSMQFYIDGKPIYLENLPGTAIGWKHQWWQ